MSKFDLTANPRDEQVSRTSIALVVIVTIAVILSLLSRRRIKASFAADEHLTVISLYHDTV